MLNIITKKKRKNNHSGIKGILGLSRWSVWLCASCDDLIDQGKKSDIMFCGEEEEYFLFFILKLELFETLTIS